MERSIVMPEIVVPKCLCAPIAQFELDRGRKNPMILDPNKRPDDARVKNLSHPPPRSENIVPSPETARSRPDRAGYDPGRGRSPTPGTSARTNSHTSRLIAQSAR